MKKLFIFMLAFMLCLPCLAEEIAAADNATITVTGSAVVTLKADHARISIGVSTSALTVEEASRQNSQTLYAVIEALLQVGVLEEDITTSSYSVYAEYDFSSGEQRLAGYNVTNQLTVIIRDMEHIGATLDSATAAGANNIYNIEFLSTKSAQAQDEATTYAVQDAIRKAQLLASSAGLELGDVIAITENTAVLYPGARTYASKTAEDTAGNSILPDNASVSATVTLVFELK